MNRLASFASTLVGSLALAACGGGAAGGAGGGASTSAGTGDMGGAGATAGAGTTATGMDATSSSAGATGTGGAASAEAPTMVSAVPLEGVLHVSWKNVTMGCDKIELSRRHDAGAYAVAYTLNGSATSQHDTQAVPPGMYCYTARCSLGGMTSMDSNEVCGTP